MGKPATTTLEFVPYEVKRSLVLGQGTRRVTMSARSPSPERRLALAPLPPKASPAAPRTVPVQASTKTAPRRVPLEPVAAAAETSASGAASSRTSSPSGTPPASAPNTPSRKGKERELPQANGHAAPNGAAPSPALPSANGATPNGHAAAAPRTLARGEMNLAWPEAFAHAKRPAGLHNGSMACYTNATLQVLMHTPPVLRLAAAHEAGSCLLASKAKFCMLCALRKMSVEHWGGKKAAYRPVSVHNYLGQIRKGFSKNRQEDTHEFFRFVTDALQNTALADKGNPKDLPEKVKNATWVYKIWGGKVRSRVLCLSCRKPSDTFDNILDLSMDVPARARSIADLFKVFMHEDKLDGDNKYSCGNCKRKTAATKSTRVESAPPILTLHLKRFGFNLHSGRPAKTNNTIEYASALDIAPLMTENSSGDTKYRLFAVTCHHGSSLHYGHYTSYVRSPTGEWYEADDESVTPVKFSSVINDRSAYLLSYMRVGLGGPVDKPHSASASAPISAPASPVAAKRPRDDSVSPVVTPNKRAATAVNAANGASHASLSPLDVLSKSYASDDGSSDDADFMPPSPTSPKRGLKSKHHRVVHKAAAMGNGRVRDFAPRGPGPLHHKKHAHAAGGHRAPMPFAVGQKRSKHDKSLVGRKKGMMKRMQGKGY